MRHFFRVLVQLPDRYMCNVYSHCQNQVIDVAMEVTNHYATALQIIFLQSQSGRAVSLSMAEVCFCKSVGLLERGS